MSLRTLGGHAHTWGDSSLDPKVWRKVLWDLDSGAALEYSTVVPLRTFRDDSVFRYANFLN